MYDDKNNHMTIVNVIGPRSAVDAGGHACEQVGPILFDRLEAQRQIRITVGWFHSMVLNPMDMLKTACSHLVELAINKWMDWVIVSEEGFWFTVDCVIGFSGWSHE